MHNIPPPKRRRIITSPPFLLLLTNPLCMVVCQAPLVGSGEHYFLIKYGEKVSASLGCIRLLYSTGKLRYPTMSQDTKNTTTHNNQHEQAPPYPPAALALSLHGNIRHGPRSWRRRSLWVRSRCGAFGVLSPLPLPSIGASE